MSPKAKVRAAQLGIPIAFLIAIAGAVAGNWFVVLAMALLVIGQVANYRANRLRVMASLGTSVMA